MKTNQNFLTCDQERIKRFLCDDLVEIESGLFEEHLGDCQQCQQALAAAAANKELWGEAKKHLGPVDSLSGGLTEILSFLSPSEDPKMLGRFGGYEIAGVVGQGGMSIVLKGFDQSLNRFSAIKVLAPQLAARGSARKRFAREAQAAAAVVHENVVAIHGVSSAAGLPFLVMPYVRGESLQKRLDRDGHLETIELVRIAHQVAAGLAAAHAQGLVHRDVKPANILLPEGVQRVLLTDFGLARTVDDSNLTGTGAIAGTPEFMSPEQARGEKVDARSDLFSLGTVMYAMCTGRNPFRAAHSFGVLRRIIEDQPRSIREVNSEIPPWLERLVNRLLTKSPEERFASASQLTGLLEKCLAHLQNSAEPLPSELQVDSLNRPSIRKAVLSTGIATLAVVMASLSGFVFPSFSDVSTSGAKSDQLETAALGEENQSPAAEQTALAGNSQTELQEPRLTPELISKFPDSPSEQSVLALLQGNWKIVSARSGNRKLYPSIAKSGAGQQEPNTTTGHRRWLGDLYFEDSAVTVHSVLDKNRKQIFRVSTDTDTTGHSMTWTKPHDEPAANPHVNPQTQTANFELDHLKFGLATHFNLRVSNDQTRLDAEDNNENNHILIAFRRERDDSTLLRQQAHYIKGLIKRHHQAKNENLYPYCEHLFRVSLSLEREAELLERHRSFVDGRDLWDRIDQSSLDSAAQSEAHLMHLATREREARSEMEDRWEEGKSQQKLFDSLVRRMAQIQKEGHTKIAEDIEFAILSQLQSSDQDYDRLGNLRKQMIALRLENRHQQADIIAEEIQQLNRHLEHRYASLKNRTNFGDYYTQGEVLLARVSQWRKEGKNELAKKALAEVEKIRLAIESQSDVLELLSFEELIFDALNEEKKKSGSK